MYLIGFGSSDNQASCEILPNGEKVAPLTVFGSFLADLVDWDSSDPLLTTNNITARWDMQHRKNS